MAVVRLVAVARRTLFDEPCAVLSDDGEVPSMMTVPLTAEELLGLVHLLDPWLGSVGPGREVTIRVVARGAAVHPVVEIVEETAGLVRPPASGATTSWVEALGLAHRSRVPIRIDEDLLSACRVDPSALDRVVPLTERPPLVPTVEQQRRLARAFSDITTPHDEET
jgi:hypothetical protein